jgi:hypothetical protein
VLQAREPSEPVANVRAVGSVNFDNAVWPSHSTPGSILRARLASPPSPPCGALRMVIGMFGFSFVENPSNLSGRFHIGPRLRLLFGPWGTSKKYFTSTRSMLIRTSLAYPIYGGVCLIQGTLYRPRRLERSKARESFWQGFQSKENG